MMKTLKMIDRWSDSCFAQNCSYKMSVCICLFFLLQKKRATSSAAKVNLEMSSFLSQKIFNLWQLFPSKGKKKDASERPTRNARAATQ